MKTFKLFVAALAIAGACSSAFSQLYVRVVDVGAGKCVVVKASGPGNRDYFMIYDAGNFADSGKTAMDAIRDIIEEDSDVELLVLSHSDGDHVAAVPAIVDEYKVKQSIHPGIIRDKQFWTAAVDAIRKEAKRGGKNWNLSSKKIAPGTSFQIGDAKATVVSGFAVPPTGWDIKGDGERMNAGSIVVRLTYSGKSILLCGDAVGRHIGDPVDACIAAEKFMVDNAGTVTIDSDVIVAPHHGADNGSSTRFIRAVSPEYVVFSAGSKHQHPTKSAAERYLAAGVRLDKMFRTDRNDHESGPYEWDHDRINGTKDKPGDDDVEINVSPGGVLTVAYRN